MTLPKLEQVRKEHGWARGELAIEIGTSPAHIWRIETQGTMVKRHTARKLADVLEVDLAELTNGGG